jgi:6-phosphogluconate dehydrogenase
VRGGDTDTEAIPPRRVHGGTLRARLGTMQLGMIGLGRMGANMVRRLEDAGHQCIGYDVDAAAVTGLTSTGMMGAASLEEFVGKLDAPRHVWIMVPAAFVDSTIASLVPLLGRGDTIIDGGNSWYHDDIKRAQPLATDHGIDYVDVGTSGGVFGLERGYCLMIGGPDAAIDRLSTIFDSLAPGVDAAPRTPTLAARGGPPSTAERGWLHCGPNGAGHFVKMVHNGIEYGMMAAYAEGLNVLSQADAGKQEHVQDAETAPLTDPQYYQYDIDLGACAEVWRRGSVIASWLLDLTADAFAADPQLSAYEGRVSDSGEGRWTIQAAIDEGVPVPVLATALFERFTSRGRADLANKVLSAMRSGFGGHVERKDSTR